MNRKRLKVVQVLICVLLIFLPTDLYEIQKKNDNTMIEPKERVSCESVMPKKTISKPRVLGMNTLERTLVYHLTDTQIDLLCHLVEAEAGGEDYEGKVLVANVVMNRVNSPKFPNTVEGVIMQKDEHGAQFSPVSDGRLFRVVVSHQTRLAVEDVLYGEDLSKGAIFFMARKSSNPSNVSWFDRSLCYVCKHGNHEFYR